MRTSGKNILKNKVFLTIIFFSLLTITCPIQSRVNEFIITINISKQNLFIFKNGKLIKIYLVSTSKYGIGNKKDSKKTPLGTHFIAEKIGEGAKLGTLFESRENTGKIAEIYTDATDIQKDLITTRILWLKGIEPGVNQGKGIDSYNRYIYIHGTPEEDLIGRPASSGCIRMKNKDIIELFDLVSEGTLVIIHK